MSTKPHFSLLATSFAGGPRPRNTAIILFGLWFLLFFAALFAPPVLDDADGTHANAARAMATTGDLVTLKVDGVRYLEKAPLPYWLAALCFRIFGFNTFAAHLPQALTVLLLMLLGHRWANQAFGARTGYYTSLAVLTSAGVFLFTRVLIPDAMLSLLLAASLFAFLRALGPIALLPEASIAVSGSQARVPKIKLVPGEIFASPQIASIGLEEALRKHGGAEIDRFIQVARQIEAAHDIVMRHRSATGVWDGGAEPSIISKAETFIDRETLYAIAAIRGKAADQQAVLAWYDDEQGPHLRYVVALSGISVRDAADRLLASGIPHATLEETADGIQIHILHLNSGADAAAALERKLYEHFRDGDIYDRPGQGRLLWQHDQAGGESEWTYGRVIEGYRGGSRHSAAEGSAGFDHRSEIRTVLSPIDAKPSQIERPSIAFDAGPLFYPYVMWACLAFAVLAKGLVALVFFFATTLLFLALTGDLKQWRKLKPFSGVLLFLAIAAPWHILAAIRNPGGSQGGFNGHGFLWFYFINEHLLRFLGRRIPADYNKLPSALYWSLHLVWLFPWALFLPLGVTAMWRRFRHQTLIITRDTNLLPPLKFLLVIILISGAAALAGAGVLNATLICLAVYALMLIGAQRAQTGFELSPFHRIDPQQRTILLLSLFSAVVLIFFALSTNQEYYTFPAYLPLLLLIAATITRAEQTFASAPEARRWITTAHAALTLMGAAIAIALFYGLFASRHLLYLTDIGKVLAHRGVGSYTLSMSAFFDLTTQAFAALRLPALLAAVAFAFGPALAWMLRAQRRHLAATTTIAFNAAAFLFAAHIALGRFGLMLSSKDFAERIVQLEDQHRIAPQTEIMLFGDQAYGSSIEFYLGRKVKLVNARTSSMFFGSTFPDCPPVFLNGPQLLAGWGRGPRKLVFVPLEARTDFETLMGKYQIVVAETGGKALFTDRPLDSARPLENLH